MQYWHGAHFWLSCLGLSWQGCQVLVFCRGNTIMAGVAILSRGCSEVAAISLLSGHRSLVAFVKLSRPEWLSCPVMTVLQKLFCYHSSIMVVFSLLSSFYFSSSGLYNYCCTVTTTKYYPSLAVMSCLSFPHVSVTIFWPCLSCHGWSLVAGLSWLHFSYHSVLSCGWLCYNRFPVITVKSELLVSFSCHGCSDTSVTVLVSRLSCTCCFFILPGWDLQVTLYRILRHKVRNHDRWYESGSGNIVLILADPDPQHCPVLVSDHLSLHSSVCNRCCWYLSLLYYIFPIVYLSDGPDNSAYTLRIS
jgi:hypothetical protein